MCKNKLKSARDLEEPTETKASFALHQLLSYMMAVWGLWLTVAHVASHQHVARVTVAAVAAHGVVALVVTPSVPLAALVHICKSDDSSTVNPRRRKNGITPPLW